MTNAHAIDFVWSAVGEIVRPQAKSYVVAMAFLSLEERRAATEGRAGNSALRRLNPTLGALTTAPFNAARLLPGNNGAATGLMTYESASGLELTE